MLNVEDWAGAEGPPPRSLVTARILTELKVPSCGIRASTCIPSLLS